MILSVRLLLVWLIALALPVQGLAAAQMQLCGAGHRPQAELHSTAAHDAAAHDHAGAVDADHAGDPGALDKPGCGSAAGCCIATALPAAPLAMALAGTAVVPSASIPPTYVGPDGAALERPPKPLRA